MNADDLVAGALTGFAALPTLQELVKKESGENNKATNFASMVLGSISEFSLGYYVAKPKIASNFATSYFSNQRNWITLVNRINHRRVSALLLAYVRINHFYGKSRDSSTSDLENKLIINSAHRLHILDSAAEQADPNWLLQYTEKKKEWVDLFLSNRKSGKSSGYSFIDGYFGNYYYPDSICHNKNRYKYLKSIISKMSADTPTDYLAVSGKISKVLKHQDVYFSPMQPLSTTAPLLSHWVFLML